MNDNRTAPMTASILHRSLDAFRAALLSSCALAMAALSPSPASAETLNGALAAAYLYNPQLDAERARARGIDENVSQAEGQFRPTITGTGSLGYNNQQISGGAVNQAGIGTTGLGTTHPKTIGLSFNQPIFRGFRTINGINVAEAQVRSERETLRNTEQTILLGAITAFMDTVRDQAILKLRENNQKVLADTLKSTQDQFRVGEVTRTDVAQAEASLAAAVSAIELAKANLKTSRATYERYIGHPPSNLVEPKPLGKMLPVSLDSAIGIATQEFPTVVGALYNEQAARFNIELIRGELLPTLSIQGNYTDTFDATKSYDSSRVGTVTGQLSVPIYEQGIVYSRVRQAKHNQIAALQEIQRAKVEAQNAVVAAFSQHQAARAQLSSDQSSVESNRVALAGVREEEKVGQRTKLDVLNAEQLYLNAQVNLVSTRRNVIVNDYTLLQAIGRLNMAELQVAPQVYDPEEHYFEVRRKWWGLDITNAQGHHEAFDAYQTYGKDHESMK